MCTSFVKKTEDNIYIAMNFDNNGMKYGINTKKKDWFIVYVDTGKVKAPSFGVHKSGVFFNSLCAPSNGKGDYRRGKGVIHTTKLLLDIIDGKIPMNEFNYYLKQAEIVNVPGSSVHNMICGEQGDVWIIEPGRGNRYFPLSQNEYQIMTNDSIIDSIEGGKEIPCNRYNIVQELLSASTAFNEKQAFKILGDVKQNTDQWVTELSMVFDKNKEVVYYCHNQNFSDVQEYNFNR
ncbi:hypothetical protein ACPWSR_12470 [Alloiococcus sp. CFN-8]|uniref:hypothetical protein n=1 Tax=Alloiococcus sp. CFN-8 TaxID=3416081 RepID=UPI003CF55DE0